MRPFSAVVLAGGAGRRMGGVVKPLLEVGGASMLRRVLAALSEADEIVVVGPAELAGHLPQGVGLTQEDPPGSGPVAGVAAGMQWLAAGKGDVPGERSVAGIAAGTQRLAAGRRGVPGERSVAGEQEAESVVGEQGERSVAGEQEAESVVGEQGERSAAGEQGERSAAGERVAGEDGAESVVGERRVAAGRGGEQDVELVAVVGGDLPFLTADALALLRQNTRDVALYVDDEGRRQPMVAVWSALALVSALSRVPHSMSSLIDHAEQVAEVAWPGNGMPPWQDCDTPQELERARRWLT